MSWKKVYVSVIGKYQYGILTQYYKNININNGNVINSVMNKVGSNFMLETELEFKKGTNIKFLEAKPNKFIEFIKGTNQLYYNGLSGKHIETPHIDGPFYTIIRDSNTSFPIVSSDKIINISTKCSDTSGIIANQLEEVEKAGGIINSMVSTVTPAPHSCSPIFSLDLSTSFKKNNNITLMIENMNYQNEVDGCDITVNNIILEEFNKQEVLHNTHSITTPKIYETYH